MIDVKKFFTFFFMCLWMNTALVPISLAFESSPLPPSSEASNTVYQALINKADKGNAVAQSDLGLLYALGHGLQQDYTKAVYYFELAASQGYAEAQFNLGVCYANGRGVPKDYSQAASYYELAANQGLAEAQYFLGLSYDFGDGVQQDSTKAVYYYDLAAKQGHALAHNYLGSMYAYGRGVTEDYAKAYAHAVMAVTLDASLTTLKDLLESELNPSQRERAHALIIEMWEALPH